MVYTIIYERINDPNFSKDFFYAHIPTLGLTTHGDGLEGAKKAAEDLIRLWIDEKISNGEKVKEEQETFFSKIVV
jgi:predicted RNase H-like HicB family nuclease